MIEHETGLPPQETPEEYAERLEKERKEEEELLRRLKEEEMVALREEARKVEEEAAIRRCAQKTWLKGKTVGLLVCSLLGAHSTIHFVSWRRAEEEAEVARIALEEAQAAAAGIFGAFSSTTYQLRYNASVVIQVRFDA